MKLERWLPFIALLLASEAYGACTIDQRIELSKAGYDKAEIERLCAAADPVITAGTTPLQVDGKPALPSGVEVLAEGAIAGSDSAAYGKRRCAVSEAGVTFPKKGLVGFDRLVVNDPIRRIDRDDREIFLVIGLSSGFNSEWCLLMRIDSWRYRNDQAGFIADAAKYEAQYDAITAELKRRNVRFK